MVEQGSLLFQKDAVLDPSKYDSSGAFLKDVELACAPSLADRAFIYGKKVAINTASFGFVGLMFEGVGVVPGMIVGAVNGLLQAGDEVGYREAECKSRHLTKFADEVWSKKSK